MVIEANKYIGYICASGIQFTLCSRQFHIVSGVSNYGYPRIVVFFGRRKDQLILSDLHFGKTGHFRKAGIAVPSAVYREDLLRLLSLIQYFQPRQLLVVGDLFHSRENKELHLFRRWRDDFPDLGIRLVLGNHDILRAGWYEEAGITVSRDLLRMGEFAFIHDIAALGSGDAGGGGCGSWRGSWGGRGCGRLTGKGGLIFSPGIFIPASGYGGEADRSCNFPVFILARITPFYRHTAASPGRCLSILYRNPMFLLFFRRPAGRAAGRIITAAGMA